MSEKAALVLCYAAVGLICAMMLGWFQSAPESLMQTLLYPHKQVTEIFYNIPLSFREGVGYVAADGSFAIGAECMGVNFIIMLFGMNGGMFIKYFKGHKRITWLLICFLCAVLAGVLVSCIRIIGSVPFVGYEKFPLFHSGVGITLYFTTMIGSYMLLMRFFRRAQYDE